MNVLAGYVKHDQVVQWADRTRPRMVLVMDSLDLARRLVPYVGYVVHRQYHPNDHEWQWKIPAREYVESLGQGGDGIIHQVLNEPQGGDFTSIKQVVKWTMEVIAAKPKALQIACLGFSVGNPNPYAFDAGLFDDFLKVSDGTVYLNLHEYWQRNPLNEPQHITRFKAFALRAKVLGVRRMPRILLGETGRDIGGGRGVNGDGWKNAGYTPIDYLNYYKNALRLWSEWNAFTGDAPYCLGDGAGGDWQSFNIQGAMINPALPLMDAIGLSKTPFNRTSRNTGIVNLRNAPAGKIVGKLDPLTIYTDNGNIKWSLGYHWHSISINGTQYYAAGELI